MHTALTELLPHLTALVTSIRTTVPSDEPIGIAHGHWGIPSVTRSELSEQVQSLVDLISERGADEIDAPVVTRLMDYGRRLDHLRSNSVPQFWNGNAGQAISAFSETLAGLNRVLLGALKNDAHGDAVGAARRVTTRLRGLESKLNGIEPRVAPLSTMVERIEQAYNAADQLPTDLDSLSEARKIIADLLQQSNADQSAILGMKNSTSQEEKTIKELRIQAEAVLARCETAYSAATSVGLAAAFSERSRTLAQSMWVWVGGLILALSTGSWFGSAQLHKLSELFKQPDVTASVILLNVMLSALSVGAPIWFGWLATKQVNQRFRLAEDYAFKASVSRAYEGFRRETARIDKAMEARLLSSALDRLDELPLRWVEVESHGSPWHELASSDAVKGAMKAIPGFAEQIKALASEALAARRTKSRRGVGSCATGGSTEEA